MILDDVLALLLVVAVLVGGALALFRPAPRAGSDQPRRTRP